MRRTLWGLLWGTVTVTGWGLGQVMNPADAQRKPEEKTPAVVGRLRSWELPPIEVTGEPLPRLVEEQRIGAYAQPRWTATRRFPTTRVYVVPEGKAVCEYWLRAQRDGKTTKYREMFEFEVGLPYRLQLDFYYRTEQKVRGDTYGPRENSSSAELRYALADWGVLPANPTVYLEYIRRDEKPDKFEAKLLLGGELVSRWHWGLNLVGEWELGGEEEHEYALTGGLSYTVTDSVFSLGLEGKAVVADVKEDRGNYEENYLIGPSVQIKPLPMFVLNVAPLVGITQDSVDAEIWINLGYEF